MSRTTTPITSPADPGAALWNCCKHNPAGSIQFDDGTAVLACRACLSTMAPARRHELPESGRLVQCSCGEKLILDGASEDTHYVWAIRRDGTRSNLGDCPHRGTSGHEHIDPAAFLAAWRREAFSLGGGAEYRGERDYAAALAAFVGVASCRHCGRDIVHASSGAWVDPEATGDDSLWREVCDANDTDRVAAHEPREDDGADERRLRAELQHELPTRSPGCACGAVTDWLAPWPGGEHTITVCDPATPCRAFGQGCGGTVSNGTCGTCGAVATPAHTLAMGGCACGAVLPGGELIPGHTRSRCSTPAEDLTSHTDRVRELAAEFTLAFGGGTPREIRDGIAARFPELSPELRGDIYAAIMGH